MQSRNGHSKNGKVGRPSLTTPANGEEICRRLAHGESLVDICKTPGIPSYDRILVWLEEDPEFQGRYARARQHQASFLEHVMMELVNNSTPKTANVDRLKFDALKWRMSKLWPKVYGEKSAETHVTTNVQNFIQYPTEKLIALQERRKAAQNRV